MGCSLVSLADTHSLVTQCRDTGNGYHIVGRVYGSGDVEMSAIKLATDDQIRCGGGAKRKNQDKSQMNKSTLNKSAARARTTIRRKILSIEADHMVTFTFKENLKDIDEAWRVYAKFIRLMQKKHNGKFQYVCVPEFQKRGAVHFHVAVVGFQNVKLLRALWLKASGEYGGNIDVTAPISRKGKKIKEPKKIANYISKYITKTDSVAFDKKKFSTGGKIKLPESLTGWLALGLPLESVLGDMLKSLTHKQMDKIVFIESYFDITYIST